MVQCGVLIQSGQNLVVHLCVLLDVLFRLLGLPPSVTVDPLLPLLYSDRPPPCTCVPSACSGLSTHAQSCRRPPRRAEGQGSFDKPEPEAIFQDSGAQVILCFMEDGSSLEYS